MIKNKSFPFFLLLLFLSCKSTPRVVVSKTNLEELTMMQGEKKVKVWINKYKVIGVMIPGFTVSPSQVLKDLGLELDTPRVPQERTRIVPNSGPRYSFYKRSDGHAIAQKNSVVWRGVRRAYHQNFGPGLYRQNGIVDGVLSNVIMVDFKKGTSPERIREILDGHEVDKFSRGRGDQFRVEFEKGIGYEVIDFGKQIFKYEEVLSVQHRIFRVESPTGQ